MRREPFQSFLDERMHRKRRQHAAAGQKRRIEDENIGGNCQGECCAPQSMTGALHEHCVQQRG